MLGLEHSWEPGGVRSRRRMGRRGTRAALAGTALMGAAAGGLATGTVVAGGALAAVLLRHRLHRRVRHDVGSSERADR